MSKLMINFSCEEIKFVFVQEIPTINIFFNDQQKRICQNFFY